MWSAGSPASKADWCSGCPSAGAAGPVPAAAPRTWPRCAMPRCRSPRSRYRNPRPQPVAWRQNAAGSGRCRLIGLLGSLFTAGRRGLIAGGQSPLRKQLAAGQAAGHRRSGAARILSPPRRAAQAAAAERPGQKPAGAAGAPAVAAEESSQRLHKLIVAGCRPPCSAVQAGGAKFSIWRRDRRPQQPKAFEQGISAAAGCSLRGTAAASRAVPADPASLAQRSSGGAACDQGVCPAAAIHAAAKCALSRRQVPSAVSRRPTCRGAHAVVGVAWITGALPLPETAPQMAPAGSRAAPIADEKLPATIGDPALRGATAGDPAAAYDGNTSAEGRGVLQNGAAAAHWKPERAAQGGWFAQFRLGGTQEKAGVKKDLARREL